jgi:hypothetical protein
MNAEFQPVAERRLLELWREAPLNNNLSLIQSPERPNRKYQGYLDGVIVDAGEIQAVVEMKTRDASYQTFDSLWNREVMIRKHKLDHGKSGARLFGVPFTLLYYLAQDDVLMELSVADHTGTVVTPVRIERTQTNSDIHGGEANEMNAFIDMTDSILYKGDAYEGFD